jgi:hypothetical protein
LIGTGEHEGAHVLVAAVLNVPVGAAHVVPAWDRSGTAEYSGWVDCWPAGPAAGAVYAAGMALAVLRGMSLDDACRRPEFDGDRRGMHQILQPGHGRLPELAASYIPRAAYILEGRERQLRRLAAVLDGGGAVPWDRLRNLIDGGPLTAEDAAAAARGLEARRP